MFDAPALVPRLRGAIFEARAPDCGECARGLPGKISATESLRWAEVLCNARGGTGAGRC